MPSQGQTELTKFLSQASVCLQHLLVMGTVPPNVEGIGMLHRPFFMCFLNAFLALYQAHMSGRPEIFQAVHLDECDPLLEVHLDGDAMARKTEDPQYLINCLRPMLEGLEKKLTKMDAKNVNRITWDFLDEPSGVMRSPTGGRC